MEVDSRYELSDSRTLSSIVLSCLFTIFISTWCCVRPDIPSPYDSTMRMLSTRFNIFFWVLICPEIVLLWSVRQWLEAGKVVESYRVRGWTRRHAMFLLMGGFLLCKDGQPVQILTVQHFRRLINQGAIDFPSVTIVDLQERSKFHPISAFLLFMQVSWFIIQCLTRLVDGLLITPLEVITLVIVVINTITLIFFWQKPLEARFSILIDSRSNVEVLNEREAPLTTVTGAFQREQKSSRTIEHLFWLEEPRHRHSIPVPRLARRFLKSTLSWPFLSLYEDSTRIVMITNMRAVLSPPGALGLPLFYMSNSIDLRKLLLPVTALATGTSVATYLLVRLRGYFPSESVGYAWRFNSLASTAFITVLFGLIAIANLLLLTSRSRFDGAHAISESFISMAIGFFLLALVPFVLARITLLLVSFFCLNALPGEALAVTPWTNYIPHFS